MEELLARTQALEHRQEDDAQKVDEAGRRGELLAQRARQHRVDARQPVRCAAGGNGGQRERREQRHRKRERDDQDRHAQPGVAADGVETQKDDNAPHVLARGHEDAAKGVELVIVVALVLLLFVDVQLRQPGGLLGRERRRSLQIDLGCSVVGHLDLVPPELRPTASSHTAPAVLAGRGRITTDADGIKAWSS